MKKLISIVAPMFNEEGLVHAYCAETLAMTRGLEERYDFEIILVNDGSRDDTYKLMQEEQRVHPEEISTVCLTRNFGLEGAVSAGLRKASGDAVVVMDADLQDPPALIPRMIEKWEEGADVVVGSRAERNNDSFFKKASADAFYKVLNALSGKLKLEKSAANFRLLSRKAVDQLLALPEVNGVFRVTVPYVGMRTAVIEYDRDKRFAGKTKYSLKNMIPYALDSITGISVEPLRKLYWFVFLDAVLFLGSVIGMIVAGGLWRVAWTLIGAMGVFAGILLLALTIMAQYVAQIAVETKGRPISLIYEFAPCGNVKRREQK